MNEYIFHCKRSSCGAIVYKSNKPFLNLKKKYICKRCKEEYTGAELINFNKKNIRKYVDKIQKMVNK